MKNISIREIGINDAAYRQLLEFRNQMLRAPLGLNLFDEDLSEDEDDIILVAMQDYDMVGCVMLHPKDDEVVKLRQMAVADHLQGRGLGRILVENAEESTLENGFGKIILHARLTARGFYEKLGYQPYGDVFTEVNIPHIAMQKELL